MGSAVQPFITPQQQHTGYALEFLQQAVEALDQAHSEMKDAGIEKMSAPYGAVDIKAVFRHASQAVTNRHELDIEALVAAVSALIIAVRGESEAI